MKITKNTKKVTASEPVKNKAIQNSNYKAAEDHIMAAINCMAKEAKNNDTAKDIIANLSVCLFDVKASTSIKASKLTDEQKEKIWEIVETYTTSNPKSGDWATETKAEQKEIAEALGISLEEAKQIMIDELDFPEDEF